MSTNTQHGGVSIDFMSLHSTPDKDFFQLSSGELKKMLDHIEHALDLQKETSDALEALSLDLLKPDNKGVPASEEITELWELADYAYLLLEEVIQSITHRCKCNPQFLVHGA